MKPDDPALPPDVATRLAWTKACTACGRIRQGCSQELRPRSVFFCEGSAAGRIVDAPVVPVREDGVAIPHTRLRFGVFLELFQGLTVEDGT